jgi:hypothetical protein
MCLTLFDVLYERWNTRTEVGQITDDSVKLPSQRLTQDQNAQITEMRTHYTSRICRIK